MDARVTSLPLEYFASRLSRFVPWSDPVSGASPQRAFLRAAGQTRVRIYRGGNQTGKTTIGMAVDPLLRCLGWHPFARHQPPVHGWLSALDWEWGIGTVIWPAMKAWIPWNMVRSVRWYRKSEPELPASIVFTNGSQLDFKSAEAGRGKYQGAPLHFVGVDEEHPSDIVEECRARLVRRGGDFWATLTPLRRERWVLDLERLAGTITIRADMRAAARAGILDQKAVDDFGASLPDRQRDVRLAGDYAAIEGLVYPGFHRDLHVLHPRGNVLLTHGGDVVCPWPIPANWLRYAAIDFGFGNPTAIVQCAVRPDFDECIVESVIYARSIRASRWAEIIPQVIPPLRAPLFADHDASERAELAAKGVATLAADKDVVIGLESVERWLHPRPDRNGLPRMRFVVHEGVGPSNPLVGRTDAHTLVWELEGYRYPEAKREDSPAPRDLPVKKDDHACDALRYLVRGLEKTLGREDRPVGAVPKADPALTSASPLARARGWGDQPPMGFDGDQPRPSPLDRNTPRRPSGWGRGR